MRAIPAKYVDVPTALWVANKDLAELGESFPTSIYYLLAKFGVDDDDDDDESLPVIVSIWPCTY